MVYSAIRTDLNRLVGVAKYGARTYRPIPCIISARLRIRFSFDDRWVYRMNRTNPAATDYQAKCANALLASAILMVFSRLVMASPSLRKAAMSSSARRRNMGRPALPRAAAMIQRIDRLCWRVLFTCMGTW